MQLRPKDQRALIWASMAFVFFLVCLFVALSLTVNATPNIFVGQLLFVSNVAVAISTAVIASALTGFLDIYLKSALGETGRVVVKAGGGFAVFLIVIWMNPSNQMNNLLFSSAIEKCRNAVFANSGEPTKKLCEEAIARFPNEPEPYKLFGRYWHRLAQGPETHLKARENFEKSVSLFGLSVSELENNEVSELDDIDRVSLVEALFRYASSNADFWLSSFTRAEVSQRSAVQGLKASLEALKHARQLTRTGDGNDFLIQISNFEARSLFYLSQLDTEQKTERLIAALSCFWQSETTPPDNLGFLHALESLVILATLIETQQIPASDFRVTAVLKNLENSWQDLRENPATVEFVGWYQEHVPNMLNNTVKARSEVTLPLGNTDFGGHAFHKYVAPHLLRLDWLRRTFRIA